MTGSFINRSFLVRIAATILVAFVGLSVVAESASAGTTYRRKRNAIEKRARSQQGAPYRYGGSSPKGFDCSGLTTWVYKGVRVNLPRTSSAQFDLGRQKNNKRIWKRSKLEIGDLVFHDTGSGRIGHVGIYVGGGKFVSTTSSAGVQVRSLYDSYWGPRWVGATRLPVTMRYKS